MKPRPGERGAALLVVAMIIIFLSGLVSLTFLRAAMGDRLVRNRYLTGVVRDLAENGIELERLLLSKGQAASVHSPHREQIGFFLGYRGSFESYVRPQANGEMMAVSEGKLADRTGQEKYSVRIQARIRHSSQGQWETLEWSEEPVRRVQ